jgi:hypothetical protein
MARKCTAAARPGLALAVPPADLTADHIYSHLDGDMFWWIGHGVGGAMPPFGAVLDDEVRWALIDFIHANAGGLRLRVADGRVSDTGYPVPRFFAECPDSSIIAMDQVKEQPVHILFADGDSAAALQRIGNEPATVLPVLVAPFPGKLSRGCVARAPARPVVRAADRQSASRVGMAGG